MAFRVRRARLPPSPSDAAERVPKRVEEGAERHLHGEDACADEAAHELFHRHHLVHAWRRKKCGGRHE